MILFEIEKKCEYNGFKFKKGDYISRDELHHEWEWFRNPTTHKGAIDPITGRVQMNKIDPTKTLKLP